MNNGTERWNKVDELFSAAFEMPAAKRRGFLSRVCAGDQELFREVESLLLAAGEAEEFLGDSMRLPSSLGPGPAAAMRDRERVGPYRLLRPIEEGGMGSVFLAERDDGQFRRRVAIKLIRTRDPGRELLNRFLVERQVLAQLEHPYIARLYEGGETENGLPFLVMEYVEGLAVDEYCRQHQLGIRARVEIFRKICAAVHHAHQHLLVHRDLKPGNILVTENGTPKLLDFGIAKPLESQRFGVELRTTEFGSRPMTPAYASPEQVRRRRISQASDVYSAGVLLFELLTDASPYEVDPSQPAAFEAAICDQEPMLASHRALTGNPEPMPGISREELVRQLRGDLDNILAMALRKDPRARYGSMDLFAEDLRRYLEHLPVAACPERAVKRLMRFCRRHWVPVGVGAFGLLTVLVLGAIFIGSTISQSRRLAREKNTAEQTLSLLVDIFRGSDPFEQGSESVTARQLLDSGAAKVRWEMEGQPEVRARLLEAIGEVYLSLGSADRAEPLLVEGFDLRREELGQSGTELAGSLVRLGELYLQQASFQKSENALREALAIQQQVFGERSLEAAGILTRLGSLFTARGHLEDASELNEEALRIYHRSSRRHPVEAAAALSELAATRLEQGKLDEAEGLYREVLIIQRKELGERSAQTAGTLADIGLVLQEQGRYGEAEASLREALDLQQEILSSEHPEFARTLNDLAISVHYQGRLEEAEGLYRQAAGTLRARAGVEHPSYGVALANRASVLSMLNRLEQAEEIAEEALEIKLRALGEQHIATAQSLNTLGSLRLKLEDVAGAEQLFQRSREIMIRLVGEADMRTSFATMGLGRSVCAGQDHESAQELFSHALAVRRSHLRPGDYLIANAEASQGDCLARHQGRLEEGVIPLRRSYPVYIEHFGAEHPRAVELKRRLDAVEAELKATARRR